MNKQEEKNQVSIIINGVRYDAVKQNDFRKDCQDCAFFESCLEYDTNCLFLGDTEGMIFKKNEKV